MTQSNTDNAALSRKRVGLMEQFTNELHLQGINHRYDMTDSLDGRKTTQWFYTSFGGKWFRAGIEISHSFPDPWSSAKPRMSCRFLNTYGTSAQYAKGAVVTRVVENLQGQIRKYQREQEQQAALKQQIEQVDPYADAKDRYELHQFFAGKWILIKTYGREEEGAMEAAEKAAVNLCNKSKLPTRVVRATSRTIFSVKA